MEQCHRLRRVSGLSSVFFLENRILIPAPMSDKLNFLPESLSRLESYSLLTLEGPDAVAFLQAQSMNDVKALSDGQWHWNGLLNPKGRLIALFALVRVGAERLYLLSPDFPAEKILLHLQRFVFRSKVKLALDTETIVAGELNAKLSPETQRDFISGDSDQGFSLDFSSDTLSRRLWVLPIASATNVLIDENIEAVWRDADIAHGLPRLLETQSELWTPQMLSLEHLSAFSLNKGCYPGQEIVARTHYLGQAKRQTRLINGTCLEVGLAVFRSGEKVGELICAGSRRSMGLALLQSVTDSDHLVCRENEVMHLQALTGLQRPN